MKPITPFDNFPSFANGGSRSAPGDAKYALGFVPADTLPAEWANYFFHGATKGVSDLNSATRSLWQEMNSVLSANNITPDADDNTQLLQAIRRMMTISSLAAHPVGSIYITSSSENPATTFGGGTWVQIKDRFILAAGDTYTTVNAGNNISNGGGGGEATVTLTVNQMPSHNHGGATGSGGVDHTHGMDHRHYTGNGEAYNPAVGYTGGAGGHNHTATGVVSDQNPAWIGSTIYGSAQGTVTTSWVGDHSHLWGAWSTNARIIGNEGAYRSSTDGASAYAHTHSITSAGGDQPHNNMPPYITKYVWERTA